MWTRLHGGWYVAICLGLSILAGAAIAPFLPDELDEYLGYVGLSIGIVITFAIYSRVEHGRQDLAGGVRILLRLVVVSAVLSIPFLPFYLIGRVNHVGFLNAAKEILLAYGVILAVVIALTTTLSWAKQKSPGEAFRDALGLDK